MKAKARWIFTEMGLIGLWKKSTEKYFKRVDDDLYFYDPQHKTGITLGDMGDGWICLWEDYFCVE